MKFVVGNGEQLSKQLRNFPTAWVKDFAASKILVVAFVDDNAVAAYGVRGMLNVTSLYVDEGYRRQGIGRRIREITFNEARKRGVHFLTGEVSFELLSSKYGSVLSSKFGVKVVKRLEERKAALIVFPLTTEGHLAYAFLRAICALVPSMLLAPFSARIGKRLQRSEEIVRNSHVHLSNQKVAAHTSYSQIS